MDKRRFRCVMCYSIYYAIPVEISCDIPAVGRVVVEVCQDCAKPEVEVFNGKFMGTSISAAPEGMYLEIDCGDKTIKLSGVKPLEDSVDRSCEVPIEDPFNFKCEPIPLPEGVEVEVAKGGKRIFPSANEETPYEKNMRKVLGVNYQWEKLQMRKEHLACETQDIDLSLIQMVVDYVRKLGYKVEPTSEFDNDRPVYQSNIASEAIARMYSKLDKEFPGWSHIIRINYERYYGWGKEE